MSNYEDSSSSSSNSPRDTPPQILSPDLNLRGSMQRATAARPPRSANLGTRPRRESQIESISGVLNNVNLAQRHAKYAQYYAQQRRNFYASNGCCSSRCTPRHVLRDEDVRESPRGQSLEDEVESCVTAVVGSTSESTILLDIAANPAAAPVTAPATAPAIAPAAAPVSAPSVSGAAPATVPMAAPVAAPVTVPLAAPEAAPVAALVADTAAAPVAPPAAAPGAPVFFSPMAALMAASVENFEPQCWSGVQRFCTVNVGIWEWIVNKTRKVFTSTRSDAQADDGELEYVEAHTAAGPSTARAICVCHPMPNCGSESDSE